MCRLALFYGNKTNHPFLVSSVDLFSDDSSEHEYFQNFSPAVTCSPTLSLALMLQVKEGDSTVEAGAQFQQMVNVECVQDFTEQPDLNISFYYNGNPTSIKCKLPISINKFIEPTEMTSEVGEQSYDFTYSSKLYFIFIRFSSPGGRT